MTAAECAKYLASHDRYLLLTHHNPDGDTVMSAAALCRALRRKNKKAYLFPNPQIIAKMLPEVEKLFPPKSFKPGCVIAVDLAAENLFPEGFSGIVDLCIDHHPTNGMYAKQTLVKPDCSSCGEVIMEVIKAFAGNITKTEASLLYIALTTDTGAFQYANVNPASYLAAAELLRLGADHPAVMHRYFRECSHARLRLEGLIYSGLHFYYDGKLVIAQVTRQMMRESGATEDDCDDLAGLSGRAENVLMNITVRELADGASKISVRSAPGISSSAVCEAFGGGGHFMAAGCTIDVEPEKAERLLLDVIDSLKSFETEE